MFIPVLLATLLTLLSVPPNVNNMATSNHPDLATGLLAKNNRNGVPIVLT
jgi:hypothetical protein